MRLSPRTVHFVRSFVVAAVLLAACGGQSGTVGKITKIHDVESLLNGEVASGGQAVEHGAVLSTDRTGSMEFELSTVGITCRLTQQAEATVPESGIPPLRYTNGTATCNVLPGQRDPLVLEAGTSTLEVETGVFRVKFEASGRHRVAVVDGALRIGVTRDASGASDQPLPDDADEQVVVLADQEASVGDDGELVQIAPVNYAAWTAAERHAAKQYVDEQQQPGALDEGEQQEPSRTEAAEPASEGASGSERADETPKTDESEVPDASETSLEPDDDEQPEDGEADQPAVEASDAAGL